MTTATTTRPSTRPPSRAARSAVTAATATAAIALCVASAGCSRRPPSAQDAGVLATEATDDGGSAPDVVASLDPMDLVPGSIRAFGLVMPIGTSEHLADASMKMFYVSAPMSRVMRYLQRRLTITDGDIRPLGALIRRARVKFTPPGQSLFVDVGLRDEGDRTFVTIWNRPALPPGPPVSTGESLRMAGFDPDSGRPLIGNHH